MRLIDADELKKLLPSNCDLFMQVIGAVSYTHLDVYKRQPLRFLQAKTLTKFQAQS